jgi:hypothetical protein
LAAPEGRKNANRAHTFANSQRALLDLIKVKYPLATVRSDGSECCVINAAGEIVAFHSDMHSLRAGRLQLVDVAHLISSFIHTRLLELSQIEFSF